MKHIEGRTIGRKQRVKEWRKERDEQEKKVTRKGSEGREKGEGVTLREGGKEGKDRRMKCASEEDIMR